MIRKKLNLFKIFLKLALTIKSKCTKLQKGKVYFGCKKSFAYEAF